MNDAELYRAALELSGLSSRQFAECIAWRDERTARRWSAGDPMPDVVRRRLFWFIELRDTARDRFVTIATTVTAT